MTDKEFAHLEDRIVKAIEDGMNNTKPSFCCAENCKERCGLTPVEHAEDHKDIREARKVLTDIGKTFRSKTISAFFTGLLVLLGLGISYLIIKIKYPGTPP